MSRPRETSRFIYNPVKKSHLLLSFSISPFLSLFERVLLRLPIHYWPSNSRELDTRSDETFTMHRKYMRRIFLPASAPPVLPQAWQLLCRTATWYGRWDNGRHKLKFRAIHAKTGELRTKLSDLRPCSGARGEDVDFMANLSAAIVFIARVDSSHFLLLFFVLHLDARQYFSINPRAYTAARIWRKPRWASVKISLRCFCNVNCARNAFIRRKYQDPIKIGIY